jgi:PQQ-like domain
MRALRDTLPVRRSLAGEVLAAVTDAAVRAAVRTLLADPDQSVRLRAAVALVCAADRAAVPVLIELLAEGPADQIWQAEEVLGTMAGGTAPPPEAAEELAVRQRLRDSWRTWYKTHGANLPLPLQPIPLPLLGFTTITGFSPPPDRTRSRVLEVDRHGKVRWQFTCTYPIDVRVSPTNRVLVSEGEAFRVTERDFKGNIHWQANTPDMPYNFQRLPNGNTFVNSRNHLLEYDPAGKLLFDRTTLEELVGGRKLADNQMVYLTGKGECVRLDASGKEIKRFPSGHNRDCGGVLDLTSRGTLLVSQCSKSMAEEFDLNGKSLWRTPGPVAPGLITRVRNSHFMVALFGQSAVVELDRTGKTVWRYEVPGYHPFTARKR